MHLASRFPLLAASLILAPLLALSPFSHAAPGSLDATFGTAGKVVTPFPSGAWGQALAIQPDGRMIVAGYTPPPAWRLALARHNPDGTLDAGFGSGGIIEGVADDAVTAAKAILLRPDGRIVIVGRNALGNRFAVLQLGPDGTPDASFGTNGVVASTLTDTIRYPHAAALQPDGKILIAGIQWNGTAHEVFVTRLNDNGMPDVTFGCPGRPCPGGIGSIQFAGEGSSANALVLQPDGRIVIAGRVGSNSTADILVARFEANGTLDPTFGAAGIVRKPIMFEDEAHALALRPDGRIVVVGGSAAGNGNTGPFNGVYGVLDINGSEHSPFVVSGIGNGDTTFNGLAIQPDGRMVVGGFTSSAVSVSDTDFIVARLFETGVADATFANIGWRTIAFTGHDKAYALGIDTQQRIVLAGYTVPSDPGPLGFALARLQGADDPPQPPDTTLTGYPPTTTPVSSVSFSFVSNPGGGTFECRLDAAAYAACTSPHVLNALLPGTHTFEVRARLNGLTDPTPASYTFSVDGPQSTRLWFQSTPGDYIGGGQTRTLPETGILYTSRNYDGGVQVRTSTYSMAVDFASADGSPLVPGAYEMAARYPFQGNSPGLNFSGEGRGCNQVLGRFTVLEAVYDGNGAVQRFAANFEQRCEIGGPPLYGEVRVNSSIPLTHEEPVGSTQPDAFAFGARTLATPGEVLVSDDTTIYGINAPAAIAITGGEYSVNGGAFTSAAATVSNRARVRVRLQASATSATTTTAQLTVEGRTAPFTVTTAGGGAPFTGLWYSGTGYLGQNQTRSLNAPTWTIVASNTSAAGAYFIGEGPGGGGFRLSIDPSTGAALAAGPYEMASAWPTAQRPGISLSLDSRGCNAEVSRFVILEVVRAGGVLQKLAANFEVRCYGDIVYGEMRFNSTVPYTVHETAGASMPDAFAFAPRAYLQPGVVATSDPVTAYGINVPVPISISGGEYSLNDGTFTSAPGTVVNRDRIRVRVQAAATDATTTTATVAVGGRNAAFTASTLAPGEPLTALWYSSTGGDYIGQGNTALLAAPDWTWTAVEATTSRIYLLGSGPAGDRAYAVFSPPTGTTFAVGAYELAQRSAGNRPGLDVTMSSRGCNTTAGRFVVLEVVAGSGNTLQRFAINFEQRCDGGPPLFGEFRYQSGEPFNFSKAAGDTTPEAMRFFPVVNLAAQTTVVSNETTVYGINAPAAISIAGGEYSVNGGAYTSTPGSVVNRDHVRVRMVSPATPGATATATLTVGGVSVPYSATTYQPGQAQSGLWFQSLPGDYIGAGRTELYQPPSDSIAVTSSYSNGVEVSVNGFTMPWWHLIFRAPGGVPLTVGAFEGAARAPFSGPSPGLEFYGEHRGCNRLAGRFVVLEIGRDAGNLVNRLAVNFQQRCDGGSWAYGEVRFNSTIPFSHQEAPGDTTPDAYAFPAAAAVKAGTEVTSLETTIYGINAPAPVSITGGEFSVNGGTWTAAPGTVANRDRVRVRAIASATGGQTVTATLTVGGVSAAFAVTAWGPGIRLTGLAFKPSAAAGYLFLSPQNRLTYQTIYGNGHRFALDTVEGDFMYLTLAAPNGQALVAGTYENARRWPFQEATNPGLDLSGSITGGCNTLTGRFVVHEAVYTAGVLTRLAADVEQHCEGTGAPLFGELRYDSAVPFSELVAEPPPAAPRTVPFDFDGDGSSDILWKDGAGQVAIWMMNGLAPAASAVVLGPATGWSVSHADGDFDADGRADLVWRHDDGRVALWLMNGTGAGGSALLLGPATGWSVSHVTDLDGDGRSDILWRHADGSIAAWLMSGVTPGASTVLIGAGSWSVRHAADFDDDGKSDLVLVNANASIAVWLMNGLTPGASATLEPAGTAFEVTHAADFDGDGRADLLARNGATGNVYFWKMNGAARVSATLVLGNPAWQVIAAADLDGNGNADLVWKHTDGTVSAWLMNGASATGSAVLLGAGPWAVDAVRDFNGDGRADLMWRNPATGEVSLWLMNGLTIASSAVVFGGGGGWVPAP